MQLAPVDRAALLAGLVSRGLLFLLLVLGSQLAFLRKADGGSVWETKVVLEESRLMPELLRVSMPGDAWWYRSIAIDGYGPRRDAAGAPNYAFFPLYPLLVRSVPVTGEFGLDGMLLSNAAFMVALVLLGRLSLHVGLTEAEAGRAIMCLAFFPTTYFCSMPLPESLFLALSLGSILLAYRRRWLLASLVGGLAALTRLPGVLLLVPLAVLYWEHERASLRKALWLVLVPCGTLAFLAFLHMTTGSWRSFLLVQERWGRSPGLFWSPLVRYLRHPAVVGEPWNLIGLNFTFALLLLAAAVGLWMHKRHALAAYTLVSVLLPLSTGSLQSLGRYALVAFPLYLWLATFTRHEIIERLVFAVLVTLFGWLTALFILRLDFALA